MEGDKLEAGSINFSFEFCSGVTTGVSSQGRGGEPTITGGEEVRGLRNQGIRSIIHVNDEITKNCPNSGDGETDREPGASTFIQQRGVMCEAISEQWRLMT